MSWLTNFWKNFQGARPIDRLLIRDLKMEEAPFLNSPIVEDECYVEIFVESLRIAKARTFGTTFNGMVYTSVTMSRLGEENLLLTAVSKPESLSKLDSNTDAVITVSRKMIGPVAWRGGTLGLELGLFSVKTGNVLTPVIDLVTKISETAGVGFVGTVKPFIPLMTQGLDIIAGQAADTALEVAIDTDLMPEKSTAFAIIDAPKESIDVSNLTVDKDRKLLLKGKPLQHGYCVFSLRQTAKKADFGEIPELKAKYSAFQKALNENKRADAENALTAFRLATLASPDLITRDADGLAAKAQERFDKAFPGGMTIKGVAARRMESLAEIGLYD